jgi:UDP-N-acetylglucosamine 3-dehydrogenase
VFIEKPLTTSVADAKQLLLASKKYKSPVFVGHIHLYNPAYQAAKKLLQKAGKLRMIVGEGASNGPFREDYSAMWDWAPHDLSMMLDIVREKPTSVQAWGDAVVRPKTRLHDFAIMRLNFPSGLFGVIHSSKLSPEKRRKLTVVGSKHSVVFDDTAEKKVALFEGAGPSISKVIIKENQPTLSYPEYAPDSPLTEELKAFIEMVRTKKKPKTDLESGIEVIKILEAAEKSIAEGGRIVKI